MLSRKELSSLCLVYTFAAGNKKLPAAEVNAVGRLIQKNAVARFSLGYMQRDEFESVRNLVNAAVRTERRAR
ncbi:MAG TPA: hypothetical protein VJW20_20375 [Candidatus Angelobacter sp.]|nr:hypothetical protein [Candidatus Angelobacter sp.]